MPASRQRKSLSRPKRRCKSVGNPQRLDEKRRLHLEPLEDRRLMAVGPALVAVIPNSGVFLQNNVTLTVAPRELTFRFAQGNTIDATTLLNDLANLNDDGIQMIRAGGDNAIGGAGTAPDVVVTPGFIGLGDTPREVVMRFASNLPDDLYRITIVGSGLTPLKDTAGNPFNGGVDQTLNFTLDLGTKVNAVVPQPITRGVNNVLTQNSRTVEVYFDQNQLSADAQKPAFYRLINASTGSITLPQGVGYSVDPVTRQAKATLTFASDIPAGTFKLEIGTTSESDDRITLARQIGNSMTTPIHAFIGDNLNLGASAQANDVDLYRFDLQNPVANFNLTVAPAAGSPLDAYVRIFNADGTERQSVNLGGVGVAESANSIVLPAGTYYVGVSSTGNNTYNPNNDVRAGGGSTGGYSIQVGFNDLPTTIDDTPAFDNSSFDTATVLGIVGSAGKSIGTMSGAGASISPTPDLSQSYGIQFPGAGDAPGDRNIPFQSHLTTLPGRLPDGTAGIQTITYDFQSVYGFTPQGQKFFNAITEPQKQRAREALELWGRHLGVQFQEVNASLVADMTIATGDPRAIAPTISTGTGNTNNGVNGISGTDVILSTADVSGLQTGNTGAIAGATNTAGVVITSFGHNLYTGAYVQIQGVQGNAGANGAWKITVLDQDHFSLNESTGNGFYTGGGTWTQLNISKGIALVNALVNWGSSEYGGAYFQTVMHQVGHLLGLGDNYEAPALTIMGAGETPSQASNTATAEPIFPGDADIVYGQTVHRPENRDIDVYRFTVTQPGLFRSETIAERLSTPSLLNTVLTLYQENTSTTGVVSRSVVARNDDYNGNDSYLELRLDPGVYYVAVTSVGNTEFNPAILGSGFGGRTQGGYSLTMSHKPDAGTTTMRDVSGVPFDGDGDGIPGGTYQFWFQGNTAANTIYVDKMPPTSPAGTIGSITNPYTALLSALAAASSGPRKIVRIVGNGGTDGNPATLIDNREYQIGYRDPNRLQPLADGGQFLVPKDVTVMIDAGAAFKMRRANLNAGTTPQGLVSTSGGAIQVLGTPRSQVVFTSFHDDTVGGDDDGPTAGPQGGDYGGIVFRDDSDHERDFLFPAGSSNPLNLSMPVFLNYVNNATMTYGGGRVTVDSVEEVYDPIYMFTARPSISFNTIRQSANAGMSANPNSFDDDGLVPGISFDQRRIGPDIHDNTVVSNSLNGLFVRIRVQAGTPLDFVDVPTRWNDSDIVHVVSENLAIAGTPGGSASPGSDRATTTLADGRLRIDPGMVVKLGGSRIETQMSSQLIAEGTATNPIIFTSTRDDHVGRGGTFDTNRDGSATAPAPGNWGGLVFGSASTGSIAYAQILYGGGNVPIAGGFDGFNAIEVHQADVRVANSLLQFNAAGRGTTNRNGRGTNADATIFVRGAQPIIVNNVIRDNAGPVASINANALQASVVNDGGQATGPLNAVPGTEGNFGPLVRGNRLINNQTNGMVVRGGVLTTETIWDDTDIAHVLFDEIIVPNHQVYSGVRVQSSANSSLVVKLEGANAGLTASGTPLDIMDRIGGTVQIIGQPGFPVVMTSIHDCTIGAGFTPDGLPMNDTENTGLCEAQVTRAPYADVIVVMDESGTMAFAQQFSAQFITDLENGLLAAGIGNGPTGGNRFGLVGFGGPDPVTPGHVIPVGPNNALFGTATEYVTATQQLVVTGAIEDGHSGLNVVFQNYTPRIDAAKFVILVTDEPRAVVDPNVSFATSLTGLNQFGYKLQGILSVDVRTAANQRALAIDSQQNVYSVAGAGFTVSPNGTLTGFGNTVQEYANLSFATGGTVGDISQISSSPQVAQIFSQVLVSNIVTQAAGQGAQAGDWRGVTLDQFSNDRNVAQHLENESTHVGSAGQNDNSRTPDRAQFLGNLAPNQKAGDDTRRLGFQVNGTIAADYPADVDVYSFNADSGTEVWIDIDRTSYGLDAMVELVDANGNVLARATDNFIDAPLANVPDPGLIDATVDAQSFNKDPYNGRDTYSTNAGPNFVAASGTITDVLNSVPITLFSASHGLVSGDRVLISGVGGNTAANGVFNITVIDGNRFVLNGTIGNGVYSGGGTWTKLVATSRDPIMRFILPTGASGGVITGPWFVRVRSQPVNFTGEAANTLNPGQTSGSYQIQVRIQQKDEKPGSTIRFADIRYATNAIDIQGLPYHSPLTGETVEGDNTANNTFNGAQNIGNLLRVDRNTISVGGTLSTATDVDWYRFDLGFDLLQFVGQYTDGLKTWSTLFDIDYGDGLSRGDVTLSVYDDSGALILIGRDSGVQDDQGQTTSALPSGSFGNHDPFIGPAQLPATVPGQRRSYFVAVTSDRMLPTVLDQQFFANSTNTNVRLEPMNSIARVATDPLEPTFRGVPTGGQTAEFSSNLYIDASGQPRSTLIDTTNLQALQANVRPFTLADVSLFVSSTMLGPDRLFNIDATVGQARALAKTDFNATGPITAAGTTDFNTGGVATLQVTARQSGSLGNNIILDFRVQDLGGAGGESVVVAGTTITITIDNDANNVANDPANASPTTLAEVATLIATSAAASNLISVTPIGPGTTDVASNTGDFTLQLAGGSDTGGLPPEVVISARQVGAAGNSIVVNFSRQDRGGAGAAVSVVGSQVNIILDTNTTGASGRGTTIAQLIQRVQAFAPANNLISITLVSGDPLTDIANSADPGLCQAIPSVPAACDSFSMPLSGGSLGTGSIEVSFGTRSTTANTSSMSDIAFDTDGQLYGYESVTPQTANTAGRLVLVDPGNGGSTAIGNDAIPDLPNPPPANAFEQITTSLNSLSGFAQAALAWGGSILDNSHSLFYAIPDTTGGASRLYQANPANGSAAVVQGQPWGRVGFPNSPNNALITASTAAIGQTNFATPPPAPASPVTVTFQTIQVGAGAGGTINFSAQPLGPGLPPIVTIQQASPTVLMDVTLNLDKSQASTTATFSSPQNSVDITFTAGSARPGAQGNNVVITFARANRNGAGPSVNFIGNQVAVTLDTSFNLGTGLFGTTAQQMVDAINNHPLNVNGQILMVNVVGPSDTIVSGTQITSLNLTGGTDPTTVQQLVNAINAAFVPLIGQVVQASFSGNPNTVVALEDTPGSSVGKQYTPVQLTGASGSVGFTTGLAFGGLGNFTLFGVTDEGQFLRNISLGSAAPLQAIAVSLPDPSNPGAALSGPSLRFAGLAKGPQNVENGRYANMFFAITETGILTALDEFGQPQLVFDTDGDGQEDSIAIQTGVTAGVNGLAFTPYDFNLWHPTYRRQTDPGHNFGDTGPGFIDGTHTSRHITSAFPAGGRHQDDNMSLFFGFEQHVGGPLGPGVLTDSYQTYTGAGQLLGTGNSNLLSNGGQLGVVSSRVQEELSANPALSTPASYNLPGGAYGSLHTGTFNLSGMSATDKPTFYFDYFLETQDINTILQQGTLMRDSARVYIGPFVRFDATGGPLVGGSVADSAPTETQFSGDLGLSATDNFYKGKALRFTSGPLQGQTQLISDYDGATRTFVFNTGFTAPPSIADSFQIAYGYTTWDLLATNNDRLDSQGTGGFKDGELPTFLSASSTALPSNPRQQAQMLHDNTGVWRQARVDLSRYAGMTNLQLRFDFSTAGQMPDPNGRLPQVSQSGVFPPSLVNAQPGQEYLFENAFGNLQHPERGQNNNFEGFYIDNIIIGAAERGELVINAPVDTSFVDLHAPGSVTQPRNLDFANPVPTQVLTGPYQLEIRRGTEYGLSDGGPLNVPNFARNTQTPILLIDTNERLIPDQRPAAPIPIEDFETGDFSKLPWAFTDDAPWSVTNTLQNPSGGTFSARSGEIIDGQKSGLSIDLITGAGNLTFGRLVDAGAGDTLRLFIDGRLAQFTAVDGVPLNSPANATWTGSLPYQTITVPVSAGHHNFRWTYDKNNSGSLNQDAAFIDDIQFPTPQIGVQNIYEDLSLHALNNPNAVDPPIGPTVPAPSSRPVIRSVDALYGGFGRVGDENIERPQGHVLIEQNQIHAAQIGIRIAAPPRDPLTGSPAPGGVRNLPTLNSERLVPGVTVANNVISGSSLVGIQFSGDTNPAGLPLAAVPFGRILHNTIFGSFTPTGTGIQVSNNAGPTLMNNIVANVGVGISVDATSAPTTVLGYNLYAANTTNVVGTTPGDSPIVLTATDPLFLDPANRNFYLARNSKAVDSARSDLDDRASISAVRSAIGIPASPIFAPTRDLFNQLREDDAGTPNLGVGQFAFFDRGAIERADFLQPEGNVSVLDSQFVPILDNDTARRDRDRADNDMKIRNTDLTQFIIRLTDVSGIGIDDATAMLSSQYTLTSDGVLLVEGTDYRFVYNESTDEAIFSPTSGIWPLNHTYKITINNTPPGTPDPLNPTQTLPSGVLDKAGNIIASNRTSGETSFTIFVGTLYDFGDAPDPTYPSLLANSGAAHVVLDGFYLGAGVTEENEALHNFAANGDINDDGIVFKLLSPGLSSSITADVTFPPGTTTAFLDGWLDINRDGDWNDPGEKIIDRSQLTAGLNTINFSFGNAATTRGFTYARFRLSSAGTTSPAGVAPDGEVEDYRVNMAGPPYQNPNNKYDVNASGQVSAADVLTIVNHLNAFGAGPLVLGQPPIPDPSGGGGGGRGLYVDVNGDQFMAANDVLDVINYLNSLPKAPPSGEGEAFMSASTIAAASSATQALPIIPDVLLASPGVEFEVRSTPSQPTLMLPQGPSLDLALMSLGSEASGEVGLVAGDGKEPRNDSDEEADWEDLITDLAVSWGS